MSMNIGEFRAGMLQASSIAQIFPQTVTNFIAHPLLGLVGIAASAGRALAGVFKDAVGGGVKLSADYEQSTIALGTMLGGAEKAQTMLRQMKDFAAATPFEFPEIVTSARQLVAFGVEGDKVLGTLKGIGDVAAGTAVPIKDLAYLFGTIKSSTIANTEDLNQFAQRGIPIYQQLASQLGTTTMGVKKMASESKIGFADIEKAFASMAGPGGRFFNLMEAQSHSLAGLWSTLKDTWGELTQALGQPVADALKPKLEQLTKWVNENPALVKAKFEEIGRTIAQALELAGRAVLFVVDHFNEFKYAMIGVATYKGLGPALELMASGFKILAASTANATEKTIAFGRAQQALAGLGIGAAVGGATTGTAGGTIGGALGGLGGGLLGQAVIPIPGVGFLIGSVAGAYLGGQAGNAIQQAAQGGGDTTNNIVVQVGDRASTLTIAELIRREIDAARAKGRSDAEAIIHADKVRRGVELPWGDY